MFSRLAESIQLVIAEFRVAEVDRVFVTGWEEFDVSGPDGSVASVVILLLEGKGRPRGSSLKQFGVVAHLPQLHDQIHEVFDFGLGLKHLEEFLDV